MLSKHSGFSMIEVLVTIFITVIGLLGISSLQLQSSRAVQDSGNKSQAVWILKDLSNRMNANSAALSDYATSEYSCGTAPKMCEDYNNGSNKVDAANCSASEVAAFDLWDTVCTRGYNTSQGNKIRTSHGDFISNPKLSITVDNTKNSATLKLTWDVRTSSSDSYLFDDSNKNRTDTLEREIQL